MPISLSKTGLSATSYVTGITPQESSFMKLNDEVVKESEKIVKLNEELAEEREKILKLNIEITTLYNYIKIIEEKLRCFFDVDTEFIIEKN